jgi:hypothetical protein
MSTQLDRLFLLLDPQTRRVVDLCTGPAATGDCPSYVAGQPLPCEGFRVVPLRQTSANGLPFLVGHCEGAHCPLAWIDAGLSAAEGGTTAEAGPDPEGRMPPQEHQAPGRVASRSII